MLDKVCSVKCVDSMGVVREVAVIARSRNEAAARAIEQLINTSEWNPAGDPKIAVTVQEPSAVYELTIDHVKKWSRERDRSDTIGTTALKSRISQILSQPKNGDVG